MSTLDLEEYDVLECDVRWTIMGEALRIRIHRVDKNPMGFRELWEVFSAAYPKRWGMQVFPPRDQLIDQVNKYHLFVYHHPPHGMDLTQPAPLGTRAPRTS